MDRSKALNTLVEAAELTKMIEELMSAGSADKINLTASGMRITLRTIRERIQAGHEALAREFVSAARVSTTGEAKSRPALEKGSLTAGGSSERTTLRDAVESRIER